MTGDYAGLYWTAIVYSILIPQLFWFKTARNSTVAGVFVGVSIGVGIWFDRFSIIVGGLQTDYLPSIWTNLQPDPGGNRPVPRHHRPVHGAPAAFRPLPAGRVDVRNPP